jgi:uncharacterized repeat protein (TIGR02543 family)
MKRSTVFHTPFVLTACALLALLATGCPLPVLTGGPAASSSTGSITGKVQAQSSADAAGVTVTAEATDGIRSVSTQKAISSRQMSKAMSAAQATTRSDGSYTLSGLPPGTYTLSAVSRDGLSKAMCTSVSVGAGSTTQAVVLALMRTGQIQGNVTLQDGSDPTGIVVFIAGTSCSAMTAADGSYLMSWVPAGSGYTLVMSKDGWNSEIRSVKVSINATTKVPAVTLKPYTPPQTTGSVFGTAALGASSVHAGIFVYLEGTSYICVTGSDGKFNLAGVAPGSYTIVASKEGYASQSAPVTMPVPVGPVGPVSFTLPPLGPFYVTYDANGASGGSVPVDPTTYMQSYRVVVLGNSGNLANPGYAFAGWNTQADGNGIAYTQGQTFFIANSSLVLYATWSKVVTPPNVAGYWDVTLYLQGMDPQNIGWLFIRQDGWDVTITGQGSGMVWVGTLEGQTLTITTKVPDTGAPVTFTGTVTDADISGPVSAPGFPPGDFKMVRVTTGSHLDVQGSCAGTQLSLNTEYAQTDGPMSSYSFSFDLSPMISGNLGFEGNSLSPGTYTVVDEGGGSGMLHASINMGPGPGTQASSGNVTITRHDGTGAAGSYSVNFQDGSSLSGSFDLTFNVGGTFTVQGTWMGTPIMATAPVPTNWAFGGMWSGMQVGFLDDLLEATVWFTVSGNYKLGDNDLNLSLQWNQSGGSQINGESEPAGNLHITTLTAHRLAGSYAASFRQGGGIWGSIDLKF